jgi:hypothetical protein
MSDLGDIHHFLAINVHRTHDGLFFFISTIVRLGNLGECKDAKLQPHFHTH